MRILKFNESKANFEEDLEDYIIGFIDKFGNPAIAKMGNNIYYLTWDCGINFNEFCDIKDISKFMEVATILKDLFAISKRIEKYDIEFKFDDQLTLKCIPKEFEDTGEYNFVKSSNDHTFSEAEIIRFFKIHKSTISIVTNDYDYDLITNAPNDVKEKFVELIYKEIEEKTEDVYGYALELAWFNVKDNSINISPEDQDSPIFIE